MSYEECMDLINAIIHASELCDSMGKSNTNYEKARQLRDELAVYAAGLMAWGIESMVKRSTA